MPWLSWMRLLTCLRGVASFAALVAGIAALGWLALRLERLPELRINPWPGADSAAPLIVVDAGHGGHDGGAVANRFVEKHLALALAHRLRHHLQAQGLRVKMTRQNDEFLSLEDRSRIANEIQAAAFVSVHLNTSATAPEVTGLETYFSSRKAFFLRQDLKSDTSAELAKCIQRHACRAVRTDDRGIKEKPYAVVSQTACPAVLIECGFLTNTAEAARLNRADYQDRLTEGIAFGVAEFVKVQAAKGHIPAKEVPAHSMTAASANGAP